jgi:phospholipid/cholesterol/gamma-HCH transport system ATP-binding protein
MLFDEPTTGLDPTATRMIDDLIVRLREQMGMTCISVTHDIASARRIAERWVLINSTGIVADGPSSEVLSQSEFMRHFINGTWEDSMTDRRV